MKTSAERKLIKAAAEGIEADFSAHPDGQRTRLDAATLRDLCTGAHSGWKVRDRIRVVGALVQGHLDLSGANLPQGIHFRDCVFEELVDLREARTAYPIEWEGGATHDILADKLEAGADFIVQGVEVTGTVSLHWANVRGDLRFTDSRLTRRGGRVIDAPDLRVGGTLFLDGGKFRADGEVCLRSAHVEGDLDCRHAGFRNPAGRSLDAAHVVVDGEVLCEQGFSSNGEVCLQWAQVQRFRATGGTFASDTGYALHADALRAEAGVYLDQGFEASATVRLIGADITGELCCTKGHFGNQSGTALDAERIVADDVYLDRGFVAHGEVRFTDAEAKRQFNATGGVFDNPGGYALDADGLTCGGEVYLNGESRSAGKFRSTGEVRLVGAQIGGELNCTGGLFTNQDGYALFADGMTTPGMVYLDQDFRAIGEVRLARATVGRQLVCTAGVFDKRDGTALDLTGLICHGDVLFDGGFRTTGRVLTRSAVIVRDLKVTGAEFHGDEGLDGRGMQVQGCLTWILDTPPDGPVDLSFAQVSRLNDTVESWPEDKYALAGFTYRPTTDGHVTKEQRIGWLRKTDGYSADAYDQLAQAYSLGGDEGAARSVRVASQRDLRKRGNLHWPSKAWNWFLDRTVGYGYRLHRPFLLVLALGLIGWLLYYLGARAGLIYATNGSGAAPACSGGYPCFNSFVYSFQLLIPVVDLREATYWLPNANINPPWGTLLMIYTWLMIVVGWVAGIAIIAGVTRFFRAR